MISISFRNLSYLVFLFYVLGFTSCNTKDTHGYTEASARAQYKIISFSDHSNKIQEGDLVEFKSVYIIHKQDTLTADSTKLNELFNDTITYETAAKNDLLKVIAKLQEGDSCIALFYKEADLAGRINPNKNVITPQDTIYCYIKVKRVYKGNERHAYRLEENAIARYITYSKQDWQASESGIYYRMITPSVHEKLKYNDPIKLVYKGYFLNRQVFDHYAEINPYFEHLVGTQNQLISGMEMAIKYMSYGSEAEFIFPSSLAFGKQGSSTGIVPAFKPVLYKVKILDKEHL